MSIKSKASAILVAGAMTVGIIGVTAAPASAMQYWEFNNACRIQYGQNGDTAVSEGNAYQWQCYRGSYRLGGIDLAYFCQVQYGLSGVRLDNVNDPYSWHCV
ncbi:hypothetical protein D3C73_985560 [compost metagenome]